MSVPDTSQNDDQAVVSIGSQMGPIAIIPIWILTMGLTDGDIVVYVALRSFCDRNGDCFPTTRTISKRAECSIKTVRNAVQKFRRLKILSTTNVYREGSRELAYLQYHLVDLDPRKWEVKPREGVPHTGHTSTPHKVGVYPTQGTQELTKELTKEKDFKNSSSSAAPPPDEEPTPPTRNQKEVKPKRKPTTPDRFDEFWTLYPRRVGKIAARKAWTKATRTTDPQTILEAVQAHALDARMKDPEFIPHPATWLNRGSWDDELPNPHLPTPRRSDTKEAPATRATRVGLDLIAHFAAEEGLINTPIQGQLMLDRAA